jgi:hypothetical protein
MYVSFSLLVLIVITDGDTPLYYAPIGDETIAIAPPWDISSYSTSFSHGHGTTDHGIGKRESTFKNTNLRSGILQGPCAFHYEYLFLMFACRLFFFRD